MRRWQQSSMKCAPFCADSEYRHAVVGDDADGIPPDAREAGHQRRTVARLEGVELAAVDDAGNHLVHVVGLAHVAVDDAVELVRRIQRIARRRQFDRRRLVEVEVPDDAPAIDSA